MRLKSPFPVFITASLAEARDFYVEQFRFKVVFEAEWYVQLHCHRGESLHPSSWLLCRRMRRNNPSRFNKLFLGSGVVLTIEVEDVDELHSRLKKTGLLNEIVVPLRDELWGQRHFLIKDPAEENRQQKPIDAATILSLSD